jgi:hypothetical protein
MANPRAGDSLLSQRSGYGSSQIGSLTGSDRLERLRLRREARADSRRVGRLAAPAATANRSILSRLHLRTHTA